MSYILDALRKADAERESGVVPDLHAQQYLTMPADDETASRHVGLITLAGLLGASLIGVLAWMWLGRAPAQTAAVPVVASTGSTAVAALPLPSPAPALAPSITTPSLPAPLPTASPAVVPPASRTPPVNAPSQAAKVRPTAPPASAGRALPAVPTAAPTGVADANRVFQPADLPEAIRRELAPVAVNGSSYSSDAGSRVLIANGQVLHEGDAIAVGTTLEKIGRRSAVLRFKGYRYELTY